MDSIGTDFGGSFGLDSLGSSGWNDTTPTPETDDAEPESVWNDDEATLDQDDLSDESQDDRTESVLGMLDDVAAKDTKEEQPSSTPPAGATDADREHLRDLTRDVSEQVRSSNIGGPFDKKAVTGGNSGGRGVAGLFDKIRLNVEQGALPFGIGRDDRRANVINGTYSLDADGNTTSTTTHDQVMEAGQVVRESGLGNCAEKAAALYRDIANDPQFGGWQVSHAGNGGHAWVEVTDPAGQRYLLDPWAGGIEPVPVTRHGYQLTGAPALNGGQSGTTAPYLIPRR